MIRRFVARWSQRRAVQGTSEESGQGLAEYAMILALVALVCIAGLQTLGLDIVNSPGFTTLPGVI
jgi:hypothetical protein